MKIRTGVLFFDIKVVQFQMNKWFRASGCLNGYRERVLPTLLSKDISFWKEVENAKEGLMKMNEWLQSKWDSIMESE